MLNNQAALPPDVGLLIAFDFSNFFEDFIRIGTAQGLRLPVRRTDARNGQYYWTDKQTNHAEGNQSADDSGENQEQWQIGTHANQHRSNHVIQCSDHAAPHQQHGAPG